jgi:hypothetical protein
MSGLLSINAPTGSLKPFENKAWRTWRAINEIFDPASQATRLSSGELLSLLGFKNNDLDSANFQSMLGVLRAINQLGQLGFQMLSHYRQRKVARKQTL